MSTSYLISEFLFFFGITPQLIVLVAHTSWLISSFKWKLNISFNISFGEKNKNKNQKIIHFFVTSLFGF